MARTRRARVLLSTQFELAWSCIPRGGMVSVGAHVHSELSIHLPGSRRWAWESMDLSHRTCFLRQRWEDRDKQHHQEKPPLRAPHRHHLALSARSLRSARSKRRNHGALCGEFVGDGAAGKIFPEILLTKVDICAATSAKYSSLEPFKRPLSRAQTQTPGWPS